VFYLTLYYDARKHKIKKRSNRTCLCGDTTIVSVQSTIQSADTTLVWTGHKLCMLLILTSHSPLARGTVQYMLLDTYQQYQNTGGGGHILEHNIFIYTTVKTSNFRSQLKLKIVYRQTVLQSWVQVFWNVMLVTGGLVPGIPRSAIPSKYQKPIAQHSVSTQKTQNPWKSTAEPPPSAHL